MKVIIFICILFLVSCGGGGSSSSDSNNLTIDNTNTNTSYVYIPPSGKSKDNCVAQTSTSDYVENFDNEQLDLSVWSYDEGCNNNGGGCNGNNEYQNYTENDLDNLFIEDGLLKIQPIYEINTGTDNVTQNYTSAKIMTKDKFPFDYNNRIQ